MNLELWPNQLLLTIDSGYSLSGAVKTLRPVKALPHRAVGRAEPKVFHNAAIDQPTHCKFDCALGQRSRSELLAWFHKTANTTLPKEDHSSLAGWPFQLSD